MEIEAWFLAEDTHFARLHRDLSADRVASELEFNPRTDDMQLRDRPSRDLADAYFLVQVIYDKSRERVSRTLDCLDFEAVSTTLCAKFPDLEALVGGVVEFLSRDLEGSSGPTSPN